jgi:hypothetical protein
MPRADPRLAGRLRHKRHSSIGLVSAKIPTPTETLGPSRPTITATGERARESHSNCDWASQETGAAGLVGRCYQSLPESTLEDAREWHFAPDPPSY